MDPDQSDKFKTYAAGASAVAATVTAAVAVLRLTVEQPTRATMLITFLTGAAGALWVVAAFLGLRAWWWGRTLNEHWPLAKSLIFQTAASTPDNLYAFVELSAINLSPGILTLAPPTEVSVRLTGAPTPAPIQVNVEKSVSSALLTPAVAFRVGFPIAHAPQPFRGAIHFRQRVQRGYSEPVTETFDVDFLIEPATAGFRMKP